MKINNILLFCNGGGGSGGGKKGDTFPVPIYASVKKPEKTSKGLTKELSTLQQEYSKSSEKSTEIFKEKGETNEWGTVRVHGEAAKQIGELSIKMRKIMEEAETLVTKQYKVGENFIGKGEDGKRKEYKILGNTGNSTFGLPARPDERYINPLGGSISLPLHSFIIVHGGSAQKFIENKIKESKK